MKKYEYQAKDKSGELLKGQIEADSESAAAKILMAKDLFPISFSSDKKTFDSFFNKVSIKDKLFLIKQLSSMISAGLPMSQSLRVLQEQSAKSSLKNIIDSISSDVEAGSSLSKAMAAFPKVFDKLDIALIESGEKSGNLDKSLAEMANQLQKKDTIRRKILGALAYPVFVVLAAVGVEIFILSTVVPQLSSMYQSFHVTLPLLTRIVMWISNFLQIAAIPILIVIIATIIFVRYEIRFPKPRYYWDNLKLHAPLFNKLLVDLYVSRFTRTLAGLTSSGVQILEALEIAGDSIGNVVYKEDIELVREKVKGGQSISEAMKNDKLFPGLVDQMMAVGEKTGEIDQMLDNLADYYEEKVDETVKSISSLIEPIIIVIIGGVILVLMISLILPVYNFGRLIV